jgi:release factor glutamine methyltransferase
VVDRRVLVPQPEFGPLVEAALPLPQAARVHDVGTGSGAIALAIKGERGDLVVSGSDISPAAITVARANAASLDLDVEFSVARGLPPGDYALVIANLPFQDEAGLTLDLAPEFTDYQPHVAVFAGPDGLEVIRAVLREIPTGTRIATSSAPSQAAVVRALLADSEELPGGTAQIAFTVGLVA